MSNKFMFLYNDSLIIQPDHNCSLSLFLRNKNNNSSIKTPISKSPIPDNKTVIILLDTKKYNIKNRAAINLIIIISLIIIICLRISVAATE